MDQYVAKVGDAVRIIRGIYAGEEGFVRDVGSGFVVVQLRVLPPAIPSRVSFKVQDLHLYVRPIWRTETSPNTNIHVRLPLNCELGIYTFRGPMAGFRGDFIEILASRVERHAVLTVTETVMTGVLGLSDGTWRYERPLQPREWQTLRTRFDSIDFWNSPFDDGVRAEDPDANGDWNLTAMADGKCHEVVRYYQPNSIEECCRYLSFLAVQPGLIN